MLHGHLHQAAATRLSSPDGEATILACGACTAGVGCLGLMWSWQLQDRYAFTLEPQYPIDFEMANHFTSTYPRSAFVNTLTAQRSGPERRVVLRNRDLTVLDCVAGAGEDHVLPGAGVGCPDVVPTPPDKADDVDPP